MLTILFDGIAYGMLLFILAVGLAVTMGLMNFINLAHGAFAMVGGYITVVLMQRLDVPFLWCLPLAFAGAAALGALLAFYEHRTFVAAVLLGSQTLAASTPLRSDVRLLLPSEGLLAGLGDGLRRGYSVAMEESRRCGLQPPSLQVGWLPPGADPQAPIGAAPRSHLLVAPPAAPLPAYGLLAEQQQLTVLLPLQRGVSLDGLAQLRGSDRLWPLMPGRSLEADRLAQALLADGIKRVMVVRDRSAESKALTDRFVASFANGKGDVIGRASCRERVFRAV